MTEDEHGHQVYSDAAQCRTWSVRMTAVTYYLAQATDREVSLGVTVVVLLLGVTSRGEAECHCLVVGMLEFERLIVVFMHVRLNS